MAETLKAQNLDALVAEYVSRDLSKPAEILMNAHLELVPQSREWVQHLECLAGQNLDDTTPEALNDGATMLEAVFASPSSDVSIEIPKAANDEADDWIPAVLRDVVGMPAGKIPWSMKLPGVYVYQLGKMEGCEVSLLRIKPGIGVPTHTHEGRELTLVLKGSFQDGEGEFNRGDIAIADDAIDHKPIAGPDEDCICFVVNDAPLRFTGPISRIFNAILTR